VSGKRAHALRILGASQISATGHAPEPHATGAGCSSPPADYSNSRRTAELARWEGGVRLTPSVQPHPLGQTHHQQHEKISYGP
jgi:hypothetical protein